MTIAEAQIGKNGITDNFIQTLKSNFEKHQTVKISVLPAARGDGTQGKEKTKEYAKLLEQNLGNNYIAKTIGFTIILKKFRKPVR